MCEIVKQPLTEKLIDDFYEEHVQARGTLNTENLIDQLKALLPTDQHELLYRWEAVYVERCGEELRQFADFVAGVLMAGQC